MNQATDRQLAVIIPVYNESSGLYQNFSTIISTLQTDGIQADYLLVDDGSNDRTWSVIGEIVSQYPQVQAIRFAKNCGKEMALFAGIGQIDAQRYILMDSDLQHPPSVVKELIAIMEQTGADIVSGIKADRGQESWLHRRVAKGFYSFLKLITHLDMQNSSDFKLINRRVVEELRQFQERNLFFRGLVNFVGFKRVTHPFNVSQRVGGNSRFSVAQLAKLAINAIVSYTSKPLYIVVIFGLIFGLFSLILGVQTIINFILGNALNGFSTVILVLLITGSMIMISLGIIGTYISRIYDEIKARPRYIIRDRY